MRVRNGSIYRTSKSVWRSKRLTETLRDPRLALNRNQPLGNGRFYAKIERITGRRREAKPRGQPRLDDNVTGHVIVERGELPL